MCPQFVKQDTDFIYLDHSKNAGDPVIRVPKLLGRAVAPEISD